MASEYFNSISGYTVGIPPILIVDSNGNVVTNVFTSGNVTASNVYANNYFYANGEPFVANVRVAGSNTQVQFNNNNELGASPNFTFNSASNVLSTTNILLKDQATINFQAATSNNTVGFKAPANIVANVSWTLPNKDGNTLGNLLATDATGNLYWSGYTTILKVLRRGNTTVDITLKNGYLNVLGRTGNIYVQMD
jgi:hypothetical protein